MNSNNNHPTPLNEGPSPSQISHYLPLVEQVVRRYTPPPHYEQGDLIGFGVLGLYEAFRHYDPARGRSFESFATAYIRKHIQAFIYRYRSIVARPDRAPEIPPATGLTLKNDSAYDETYD